MADSTAELLLRLVAGLNVRFGRERSFRMCAGNLLTERFLLSVSAQSLGDDAETKVLDICRALHLPSDYEPAIQEIFPATRFIHFGFEKEGARRLLKVYLEQDTSQAAAAPVLVHTAFKWDFDNSDVHVETRYMGFPSLTAAGIQERIDRLYDAAPALPSRITAQALLRMAAARTQFEGVRFLEVGEQGTPRRSFDLNVYSAEMRLKELAPLLRTTASAFGISSSLLEEHLVSLGEVQIGHVAGGVHRLGEDFLTIYYGMEAIEAQTAIEAGPFPLELTTPADGYFNYCWWPYRPLTNPAGKLRPVNLLYQTFELAGVDRRAFRIVAALRDAIGLHRTVFGVKWVNGRLAWEFYFYDYKRRMREVSITRVLDALQPHMPCDVPVNENLPYFMFSLDFTPDMLAGAAPMDVVHMYVGNPGSAVSSGIAYALRKESVTLENFYFFFDAQKQLREASEKIYCSAHVDMQEVDIERILWPELTTCRTICVANKQTNDTAYFSEVNVNQVLFFLERLHYPPELIDFVQANRHRLDHLLFDVGFDYQTRGSEVRLVKSGFYGVF